jgi:hypothetical protein
MNAMTAGGTTPARSIAPTIQNVITQSGSHTMYALYEALAREHQRESEQRAHRARLANRVASERRHHRAQLRRQRHASND